MADNCLRRDANRGRRIEKGRDLAIGGNSMRFYVFGIRKPIVQNETEEAIEAATPQEAAAIFRERFPDYVVDAVEGCPVYGDGKYREVAGRCESCGVTIFYGEPSSEDEDGVRVCGACCGHDSLIA